MATGKSYKFFNWVFFVKEVVALIVAAFSFFIVGRPNDTLKELYWMPWALLIAIALVTYLFYIRGVISFYPRPDFADDFQNVSSSFKNFMSDSNFYSQIKNVIHYGKIPAKLNDNIYQLQQQIERNPIKIRSVRLRIKLKYFVRALSNLTDHLEQNYFLEDRWYVTKSPAITQVESKSLRTKTEKYMKTLASSYSSLFSEVSHLGGHPFEVNLIYVEDKS